MGRPKINLDCSVGGCDNPAVCRGYCRTHYSRWYRHGDPGFDQIRPTYMHGEGNPRWKGGRYVSKTSGYAYIWVATDDPLVSVARKKVRGGCEALEHRMVMARYLGRPLYPHETVHHINGVKDDNRLENLQLRAGQHGMGSAFMCLDCGSQRVEYVPIAEGKAQ